MLIAQQKKQNNIAEYIVYMYQLEDLIRAYDFDIHQLSKYVILPQLTNESFEKQTIKWYEDIIKEMKTRHLEESGHLFRIGEVMTELIYLHNTLKDVVKDKKYITLLEAAEESIATFRNKSNLKKNHPVEVCFQALYMKLLLKLKKEEISGESEEAFDKMRIILAYLAKAYHKMKSGDMSMLQPNE